MNADGLHKKCIETISNWPHLRKAVKLIILVVEISKQFVKTSLGDNYVHKRNGESPLSKTITIINLHLCCSDVLTVFFIQRTPHLISQGHLSTWKFDKLLADIEHALGIELKHGHFFTASTAPVYTTLRRLINVNDVDSTSLQRCVQRRRFNVAATLYVHGVFGGG